MCGGVVEGNAGKRGELASCAQATSQKLGQHCAAGTEHARPISWAVPFVPGIVRCQCASTNLVLRRIWPSRSANGGRQIKPPWRWLACHAVSLGYHGRGTVMPCPSPLVTSGQKTGATIPPSLLARRQGSCRAGTFPNVGKLARGFFSSCSGLTSGLCLCSMSPPAAAALRVPWSWFQLFALKVPM